MPQRLMQRAAAGALLSGLLLILRGRSENGDGAVPLNAISHWLWPRSAFRARGFSLRHTATGALIHFGASCFWSAIFEGRRLLRPAPAAHAREVVTDALALSAAAAWVDLVLVPPALSPGFERRLHRKSLCLVYLGFAAGLALGELWPDRRRPLPARARPEAGRTRAEATAARPQNPLPTPDARRAA